MSDMITAVKNIWPEYFEPTTIVLTNGEKIIRRYGKYQPGIAFFINEDNNTIGWLDRNIHRLDLNIEFDASGIKWIPGDFWISKKGTKCFRPKENGEHVLVEASWGGCFDDTRGTEYNKVKDLAIYARCASSNGGGMGCNYYIFPREFHNELTEDDI